MLRFFAAEKLFGPPKYFLYPGPFIEKAGPGSWISATDFLFHLFCIYNINTYTAVDKNNCKKRCKSKNSNKFYFKLKSEN